MLFLHVTTRIEGVPHDGLLKEKGFGGFPTLAFLDASGDVLTSSIDRSVKGFQRSAKALAMAAELAADATAGKLEGDRAARWVMAQIDLGKLDFAAAKARLGTVKGAIAADLVGELEERLLDLEVAAIFAKHQAASSKRRDELMSALRSDGAEDAERRANLQAELAKLTDALQDGVANELRPLVEQKRIPSDKNAFRFWLFLVKNAERRKDEPMVARARSELAALAAREPAQKAMIERLVGTVGSAAESRAQATTRKSK